MIALLLALQVAATPPAGTVGTDSAIRARVDSAILRFQLAWRDAWAETRGQLQALGAYDLPNETRVRVLALHCHYVGTNPWLRPHVVTGTVPSHATCPTWLPGDGPKVSDERYGIDGALSTTRRWRIRELRRTVRLLLDSAAAQLPGDERMAAQRLRFAMDDGDERGTVKAAATCDQSEGYCGMLRAHVLYRAGRMFSADSAFLDALALMPASERCAWRDISVLLPRELRQQYARTPCEDRSEFEEQFWWLSDPLWLEPGNERRAEQFARKVQVTMLAPLGVDERQRWRPEKGGEAVAETLLRYGWPTQFYWGGPITDAAHDQWLIEVAAVDTAHPYLVREYSRDRLHTVPAGRALLTPLEATATDWTLNGLAQDKDWWPEEHFGRDAGAVVQLRDGQGVMLRRRTKTHFAWATDLDTALVPRSVRDSTRAMLFEARGPDSTKRVASFTVRAARPLVVDGTFTPGRVLVGVEIPGGQRRAAARTRFSVDIAPALAALGNAKAVSQPVLIEPPAEALAALPAEAAIARMKGSTTLSRSQRIGIYWEAYGFAPTDTVEIALALSREGKPGMFERVVSGFGLWGEEGGRADVRWTEVPGSGRTITRMEGAVPVQMRSVSLDLRRQRAGRYKLEVSVKTPGGASVTSERMLTLR